MAVADGRDNGPEVLRVQVLQYCAEGAITLAHEVAASLAQPDCGVRGGLGLLL